MSLFAEARSNTLFAVVGLLFLYAVWCVWDRQHGELPSDSLRPPIVLNDHVRAGATLLVRYSVVRRRICGVDVTWIVKDSSDKRKPVVEPHVDAIGNLGEETFVRPYPIPADAEPGPATLTTIPSWSCPENLYEAFSPRPYVQPPIYFTIEPPK